MMGKSPNPKRSQVYESNLSDFSNPRHELWLLAKKFDWQEARNWICFILFNHRLSGETGSVDGRVVDFEADLQFRGWNGDDRGVSKPYYQLFCGEVIFQWEFPCAPSALVSFRQRIGGAGVEKIFSVSIVRHGKEVLTEDMSIDTTVQEKRITYPTDTKVAVRIIKEGRQIAQEEGVKLRQSYKCVGTDLLKKANSKSKRQATAKKKARKKLKTIAGRLGRELRRKLRVEGLARNAEKRKIYEKV